MAKMEIVDLDAVSPDETELVVKLGGVEHKMKTLTLADVIEGMKIAKSLGVEPDPVEEFKLLAKVLVVRFPTMTEEMLAEVGILKLRQLVELVQKYSGEQEIQEEAAAKAGANPQPAG